MDNKFSNNIILIDLSKQKSDLFKDLLKDNNLSGKICPDTLSKFKSDGYIKLWIDSKTYDIIAFTTKQNKKDIQFSLIFKSYMRSIKHLKIKEKDICQNIDSILDKISLSGMGSLTPSELKFLKGLK
jgi:hypothetical protein